MKLRHYKPSKGYTLLEVLIALSCFIILSSVAVISYQSTTHSANLKHMHNTAKLFVTSMHSCISSAGAWEIDKTIIGGLNITPCSTISSISKLNFKCPHGSSVKPESAFDYEECKELTTNHTTGKNFVCLDFRKKISNKKHQIVTIVNTKEPDKYKIYCKQVTSYENVTNANCEFDIATPKSWNSGNTNEVCEWPTDSKTEGSTTGTP